MKKPKLVQWQETRELTSKAFDSDLNTAGSLAMQMNIFAREVLTAQQFSVYDAVLNKGLTFSKISDKLKISVPRVSELWHLSSEKIEDAWRERNLK